jgi:hypothetical protein
MEAVVKCRTTHRGDKFPVDNDNIGVVVYSRYYKKTGRNFIKVKVEKPVGRLKARIDHEQKVERALFFGYSASEK